MRAGALIGVVLTDDVSTDPDAEKKMKEINKAYDLLSGPDKHARHDNFENIFEG